MLAVYLFIQLQGANAPFSHGDDQLEVAFVNGVDSFWRLLGTDVFKLFRPIKNLLFAFFSRLSSFDGGMVGCRLTAAAVGVFSFFAVKAFSRRIFAKDGLALLAAGVWLLSPTLVSSAAWLSCVNIQLMCAFVALAGVAHLDDRPGRALAWLVLACLSYEQAVVVGPCLVVCDFFLRPERLRRRKTWLVYSAYAAATVAYLAARTLLGSSQLVNGSFVGCSRLDLSWASAYLTGLHFFTWLWPFGRMAVFGGYANGQVSPGTLAACWIVTVLVFAVIWHFRKRRPALALGLAWAWVAFLPLGNLAGLRNGPYGDYYLGISSMGFAWAGVALVRGVSLVWNRSRIVWLALAAGFFALRLLAVGESFVWARLWATPELAYRATVKTFPKAYFAHVTLARFLCDHGRYDEAEAECAAAESLMGGEKEKLASVHLVRALGAMLGRADADEAEKWIRLAAAEDGVAANRRLCHYYQGCVCEDLRNDAKGAEREYAAALPDEGSWDVDAVRVADRYARLLALRGELRQAVALWERAARIAPADPTVAQNLRMARTMIEAQTAK